MKLVLTLLLIIILACNTKTEIDEDSGLPLQKFITNPEEKFIHSLKDTVYHGDTLTIHFKTPHPKDLAIYDPDNRFFFLVYGANEEDLPPLVNYLAFANLDKLNLIINKTKANPWNTGIKENQLIFTKPGKYQIWLSDNLETDDGTPVEVEEVYFTGKPKPK